MRPEEVMVRRGVSGGEQLDELQRGQDQALSVEDMDRGNPTHLGSQQPVEFPIPDPGARPGAVRLEQRPEATAGEEGRGKSEERGAKSEE
jgi:hypothetical protein